MPEAVVIGAFLRVAQNRVGFGGFLEVFFGFLVSRIPVGVILKRELAVGALDFLIGGVPRNPEHLVVIPFSVQVVLVLLRCDADHRRPEKPAVE